MLSILFAILIRIGTSNKKKEKKKKQANLHFNKIALCECMMYVWLGV